MIPLLMARIIRSNGGFIPTVYKVMRMRRSGGILWYVKILYANHAGFISSCDNKQKNRIEKNCIPFRKLNLTVNKKIGIHVHLYYLDLLDEIIYYLTNIKHRYNLFITIPSERRSTVADIYKKTKSKLIYAERIEVLPVENRGRNFGPFLVALRGKIDRNEYILHIHSKKSLYSGKEQFAWRRHVYDSLLGSPYVIDNILWLLENSNVGYIAPKSSDIIPYWAHSWLSNTQSGALLSEKLMMSLDLHSYADFSVGSMFWCKKSAIKQLFDVCFQLEDFPQEPIPNDGTICHAIERCFGQITKFNGFEIAEVDVEREVFNIGSFSKNLSQYWKKTIKDLVEFTYPYKTISFDIYDTVVTRILVEPDDIFKIMQEVIDSHIKAKIGDFVKLRKTTETILRAKIKRNNDVNIDQIYSRIAVVSGLNTLEVKYLMDLEISLEKILVRPRQVILQLIYNLIEQGKRIIFSSDMYLTTSHLKQIMGPLLSAENFEIKVSSETGLRKDRGDYWDNFKNEIECHIGDNEHSDIQLCVDRKIPTFHVMSPKRMLELCNNLQEPLPPRISAIDSIILGLSMYKIFSDPFALHDHGDLFFKKPNDFGYAVIGPLVFTFMLWLHKHIKENNINKIAFLSREGFYLEKMYKKFLILSHEHGAIEVIYLECSRRAVVMASLENSQDVYESLDIPYNSTFSNLMFSRYGIEINKNDRNYLEEVSLPQQKEKVKNMMIPYINEIIEKASVERNAYLKYLNSVNLQKGCQKFAVVDIGYSGTMQKYLQKIIDSEILGYYMYCFPDNINKNNIIAKGCFGEMNREAISKETTIKTQILEAIMTAPTGQLVKFINIDDGKLQPVRNDHVLTSEEMKIIDEIWNGVEQYIEDATKLILNTELIKSEVIPSKDVAMYFFNQFCLDPRSMVDDNVMRVFKVDDRYVSNRTLIPFSERLNRIGDRRRSEAIGYLPAQWPTL
ncbi:MAG TPA: rhamnan synthesis F family protein [Acetivibrio sp.]|uniref:rhamnan synthesis F family protein n=1 Tax=Acetivibrio sp. TaxID=1872092 RepID=UPI002C2977EF|nr:rhamnan synthesis F family protein [Acetivibrio sp.]HOM03758.1 rhamnan synthesis F family protein [Acetivibrio sp.]